MHNKVLRIVSVFCILFFVTPHVAMAVQSSARSFLFTEPGPICKSTLYVDGSEIELQTEKRAWPIIGSDMSNMTPAEFKQMVHAGQKAFENSPNKIVVSGKGGRNLNLVFNISNPPPGAAEALEAVATYLEAIFEDSCTVTMNINFASLPPGVLGWTMSYYINGVAWPTTRSGLIADMDADDSLHNWLPTGSTIPVRYTYGSSTVTDEDGINFTVANYNAAIGYYGALCAVIEFNTDFSWDYDPGDGITGGHCFQSVAAHEIGHCLGFTTSADVGWRMDAMDIIRFQRSDDGGDYNPDDLNEFQTTARLVDEDELGAYYDDVNSDLISNEWRMADGSPYQSSHFSQGNVFGIMQPAQASGETWYPHFYKHADKEVFDFIGWDCIIGYGFTFYIHNNGSVITNPDAFSFLPGTEVELTAVPDSGYVFDYWEGDLTSEQNPDTVLMDGEKVIDVYFAAEYHTLTINIVGQGSVEIDPDLPIYSHDSEVELTAVADPGWYFHHWSGGLSGFQNPDTLVMDSDKTVYAHFFAQYIAEGADGQIGVPFIDVSPNPFNEKTNILYQVVNNSTVTIEIYNAAGQLVKDYPSTTRNAFSPMRITWDGRDNFGQRVSNGVYFLRFVADPIGEAEGFRQIQKLLVVK